MKVRAIAKGYYANAIREEDDIFDVPEGMTATWFIPLKDAKKLSPVADDEPPATPEEAKKLSNEQLRALLTGEGIKFVENATKAELIKAYFDAQKKQAADNAANELV